MEDLSCSCVFDGRLFCRFKPRINLHLFGWRTTNLYVATSLMEGDLREQSDMEAKGEECRGTREERGSLERLECYLLSNQTCYTQMAKTPAEDRELNEPQRGRNKTYQHLEVHRVAQGNTPYNRDYDYLPWRSSRGVEAPRLVCVLQTNNFRYRTNRQYPISLTDQPRRLANPQMHCLPGPPCKQ
eukprot:c29263_g1_i2 orf=238-792(-)